MRLEHLCDVDWTYAFMRTLAPADAADGRMYGQGDAVFSGRVAGRAQWSNFPRLHRGRAFPDARGALEAEDGDLVLFTLTGMSSLSDGRGLHVMSFTTQSERLDWLNDTFAVGEGAVDGGRGVLAMRYYACEVEYLPELPSSR